MWCKGRILKESWTDVVTNEEEVLGRVSERRSLWCSIEKRRNEWIGRVIPLDGSLILITEGYVEGKNLRGRPRMEYYK